MFLMPTSWRLMDPLLPLAATLYDSFKSANNDLRSLQPRKDAFQRNLLLSCYRAGYLKRQFFEEIDIPDPDS